MPETPANLDQYMLDDGAKIAVVGGGPSGSFFSIFALKMADMIGKKIDVTIYEPKNFTKDGPLGCNHCGGIISELLVQTLAVEGINLPEKLVQRGINSYRLHTTQGSVSIETPGHEKTIAAIYRGGGPKGIIGDTKESFDNFLLTQAVQAGAVHVPVKVEKIEYRDKKPVLYSKENVLQEADLVVGAVGIKSSTNKIFEEMGFGYKMPNIVTAAIAEIGYERSVISEHFGNSIQLFLLPIKDMKFAAMIPKGTYITVCVLGKNIGPQTVTTFLSHPVVQGVLPKGIEYKIHCRCLPKMNIQAPEVGFNDRVVMCGDSGSSRLFKDGLNAAYIMGKAAAKTAIFQGVGKAHFQTDYYPVYKSLVIDNNFGKVLYALTDMHRNNALLTRGMLEIVRKEQNDPRSTKTLSSVLWDMFTGNERYKNIFPKALQLPIHSDMWTGYAKALFRRNA